MVRDFCVTVHGHPSGESPRHPSRGCGVEVAANVPPRPFNAAAMVFFVLEQHISETDRCLSLEISSDGQQGL